MASSEMQRFCVECGKPLDEGAVFCTHCGTRVAVPDAPAAEEAEEANTAGKPASEMQVEAECEGVVLSKDEGLDAGVGVSAGAPTAPLVASERVGSPSVAPDAVTFVPAGDSLPDSALEPATVPSAPAGFVPGRSGSTEALPQVEQAPRKKAPIAVIVAVVAVVVAIVAVAFAVFGLVGQKDAGDNVPATVVQQGGSDDEADDESEKGDAAANGEAHGDGEAAAGSDSRSDNAAGKNAAGGEGASAGSAASSSDGASKAGASADDYLLPESDSRVYSRSELEKLSTYDLYLARNEIFARHGRMFQNDDLVAYFGARDWYVPTTPPEQFSMSVLSPVEKANIDAMGEIERERNSPYL